MKWLIVATLGFVLAACGQSAPEQSGPSASTSAESAPAPAETPRYVGLWGASVEACSDPAWTVREDELSTKGEVHCDFNSVTPIAHGYQIAATCYAEAPPAPYEIQFTFADGSDALLITGGPWAAPTSLVPCGPLPAE